MPESLGKKLKAIRESKRFSIEDVSERSRIHKDIISSIEEGRLNELKSGFYAKSFVKTYAAFLGVLNDENVKEYLAKPNKNPEGASKQKITTRPVSGPKAGKTPPISKIPKGKTLNFIPEHKKEILMALIGIFILWSLSLGIGWIGKSIKKASAKKEAKPAIVKKETPKKIDKQKPNNAIKEVKKEVPAEKPYPAELEVFASDNTWLQVVSDGELVFAGTFKKGSKDTWKAKREIKLEVWNSGAVKINVNGLPADFSGKKGEKKEIVITKDGMK